MKLELQKKRQKLVSLKGDPIAGFEKLEGQYPNYIQDAQMASNKFFISFCSPEVKEFPLPFDKHPLITDVTYKALPGGFYFCFSVIFIEELDKHVVIFQAIFKKVTADVFAMYFESLFEHFDIQDNKFLGAVMDFSEAQRSGFQKACSNYFDMNKAKSLSFLKGCFMHWRRSVQRIVQNHKVVPVEDLIHFLGLTYRLERTNSDEVFLECGREILSRFPATRNWLKWWLQPSISSMIFTCRSLMKPYLKNHPSRTSNAIEAYHGVLYSLTPKRQPVMTALKLMLQASKRDGKSISLYCDSQVLPNYKKKPATKKNTKKKQKARFQVLQDE